jgi:hypothetical protein
MRCRIFKLYFHIYTITSLWYGRISAPNPMAEYEPFMYRKLTVNDRIVRPGYIVCIHNLRFLKSLLHLFHLEK